MTIKDFHPEDWPRFVHDEDFTHDWIRLGLTDDQLRSVEMAIMLSPKGHPVVAGTGGMRKLRLADPMSNKGKSGGFRVYYAHFEAHGIVFLAAVFGKNERSDLNKADKALLSGFVQAIETLLENGTIR